MTASLPCPNCGSVVVGRFCSHCGQNQSRESSSLRHILAEVFSELTDLDSRFWRTLITTLFQPGKITRDYFDYRRARYLPPFRMYLLASIALFFVMGWFAEGLGANWYVDLQLTDDFWIQAASGDGASTLKQPEPGGPQPIVLDAAELGERALSGIPQLGFVLLPFGALLLKGLYYRRRRPFGDHFVSILHLTTGVALILSLTGLIYGAALVFSRLMAISLPDYVNNALYFVAALLAFIHVTASLHGIYRGRWRWNFLRSALLQLFYLLAAFGAFTMVLIISAIVLAWE